MLGLLEVLRLRSPYLDPKRTKLVRHKAQRFDMHLLKRQGWLNLYQGFQQRPVFHGCDTIVSFVGEEGRRSRLLGVYRVEGRQPAGAVKLPAGCPPIKPTRGGYFYTLTPTPGMDDLVDRLVIDWGAGTRSWHQRLTDKEVLEIGAPGHAQPPFRDYVEFSLTHGELCDLVTHADANRDWRSRLEAVGGVYLILASGTGQQYVGSATGDGGIWARWAAYARTGHGGNEALKRLLKRNRAYPSGFVYSILQVFPKTFTRAEALAMERRYKDKLGSRAQGLNLN